MAWETRNGKGRYYTRSTRNGDRVVREYIGCGKMAEMLAKMDSLEREQREAEAEKFRAMQAKMEKLDEQVEELCDIADLFARMTLLANGYHQHNRGDWRKRRVKNQSEQ